ncbi:unnamed protein product, partial [Prorocentrum cordatum]
ARRTPGGRPGRGRGGRGRRAEAARERPGLAPERAVHAAAGGHCGGGGAQGRGRHTARGPAALGGPGPERPARGVRRAERGGRDLPRYHPAEGGSRRQGRRGHAGHRAAEAGGGHRPPPRPAGGPTGPA